MTPNFSLEELTRTDTGLPNRTPVGVLVNLQRLAEVLLEPARELVGPLRVTSGYRSPEVNAAVGGVRGSAHLAGLAADVVPVAVSPAVLFDLVRDAGLPYDQLILEPGWVHLAIAPEARAPRRQALTAHREGGRMVYREVRP